MKDLRFTSRNFNTSPMFPSAATSLRIWSMTVLCPRILLTAEHEADFVVPMLRTGGEINSSKQ